MAKIVEKQYVITLSKIVKDTDSDVEFTDDLSDSIESIVEELVDSSTIVEVRMEE
jgi:hypothetical protein